LSLASACSVDDLWKAPKTSLKGLINMPAPMVHVVEGMQVMSLPVAGQGGSKPSKNIWAAAMWALCHQTFSSKDVHSTEDYTVVPMVGNDKDLIIPPLLTPNPDDNEDFTVINPCALHNDTCRRICGVIVLQLLTGKLCLGAFKELISKVSSGDEFWSRTAARSEAVRSASGHEKAATSNTAASSSAGAKPTCTQKASAQKKSAQRASSCLPSKCLPPHAPPKRVAPATNHGLASQAKLARLMTMGQADGANS
jgi:hypothetical protein